MALPQILAVALVWFLPTGSAIMWGVVAYLVTSYGLRLGLLDDHRAGIKAVHAGDPEKAIRHFQASYRFFSSRAWLDRWRSVLLLSASGASYREMALVNVAFCEAQLGRRDEARATYARALAEFPGSPIATAALNLLGPRAEVAADMEPSPSQGSRKAYRLNVAGDFYVEDGCCTLCGVPGVTAPELFGGFNADCSIPQGVEQCWVKRQPSSPQALDAMVATMAQQELDCIRYRGDDNEIVRRLHSLGQGGQID